MAKVRYNGPQSMTRGERALHLYMKGQAKQWRQRERIQAAEKKNVCAMRPKAVERVPIRSNNLRSGTVSEKTFSAHFALAARAGALKHRFPYAPTIRSPPLLSHQALADLIDASIIKLEDMLESYEARLSRVNLEQLMEMECELYKQHAQDTVYKDARAQYDVDKRVMDPVLSPDTVILEDLAEINTSKWSCKSMGRMNYDTEKSEPSNNQLHNGTALKRKRDHEDGEDENEHTSDNNESCTDSAEEQSYEGDFEDMKITAAETEQQPRRKVKRARKSPSCAGFSSFD
eukprot:GILJ01020294.1.p1 GENE.GILJ01020294.1~~GILJ01020294.1.p1  ORF type:complete len:288 (+),score=34.30 GILJ01020294.1:142-1005(+)